MNRGSDRKQLRNAGRLLGAAAFVVWLGCAPSAAQVAPRIAGMASTSAPVATTLSNPAGVTRPPASAPAFGLGTVFLNLGAPVGGIAANNIIPCPVNGLSNTTLPVDPAAPDPTATTPSTTVTTPATAVSTPITTTMPGSATILPSTTLTLPGTAVTSPFGVAAPSGLICANALPAPAPASVDSSTFANGAVPLSSTEADTPGLSPLIAVPDPTLPAVSCTSSMTSPETATLPDSAVSTSC